MLCERNKKVIVISGYRKGSWSHMTCLISQMRLLVEVEVETQLSVQSPNENLSHWQN